MFRSSSLGLVLVASLVGSSFAGGYPAGGGRGTRTSQTKGWFQEQTGVSTPRPIQALDPSHARPRPDQGGYTDMWANESQGGTPQPPFIDGNGNVWSGSAVRGQNGQILARAQLTFNAHGHAYWSTPYQNQWGVAGSVRAPGYDRQFGGGGSANGGRALLEWDALNRQGATRPTLMSTMPRRGN